MASFGFVLRAYRTETNTEGLVGKLCKKKKGLVYNLPPKCYAYILRSLELPTNANISTFLTYPTANLMMNIIIPMNMKSNMRIELTF